MRLSYLSRRRAPLLAAGFTLIAALGVSTFALHSVAQSDPTAEAPADSPAAKPVPKKKRHATQKANAAPHDQAAEAKSEAPAAVAPRSGPDKPAADKPAPDKAPFDFAAQLDRAGASSCKTQLNALAVATMGSVEKFNTISSWSQQAGDKRSVSIAIGQKYADGSAVPFGAAEVVASPNQQGSCDGFSVQVVPSPLSCGKLREAMARNSKPIGDLAGIAVLQDTGGRTMLVPTKADTCVLVATRSFYAR